MSYKVISWRHAIQKAPVASTTKLVLFNLSVHMNDAGESCFPSVEKQAEDTGLSKRAVITHIDNAVEAGLITKKQHGYAGQKWKRNEYFACFPDNFSLGFDKKKGGERGSLPYSEGGERDVKGGEPNDTKAVKEVHSNSTVNSTDNSTGKKNDFKSLDSDSLLKFFQEFWEAYPRKEGYESALFVYEEIIRSEKASPDLIKQAAEQYAIRKKDEAKYQFAPKRWLSESQWNAEKISKQSAPVKQIRVSPIEEDPQIWQQVFKKLRQAINPPTFKSWLENLRFDSFEEGVLILKAPTGFIADYLENHYTPKIKELCPKEVKTVRFTVNQNVEVL